MKNWPCIHSVRGGESAMSAKSLTDSRSSCSLKPSCLTALLVANKAGHQRGLDPRADCREGAESADSSQVSLEGPVCKLSSRAIWVFIARKFSVTHETSRHKGHTLDEEMDTNAHRLSDDRAQPTPPV